jgi:hypothetical protein
MRSEKHGESTSELEVTNISVHGFWILLREKEYYLAFAKFPWFKQARISEILNVLLLSEEHLYWPEMDLDLSVEIIENPDKYPEIYKE